MVSDRDLPRCAASCSTVSISRKVVGGQARVSVATAFCGGSPSSDEQTFFLLAVFTGHLFFRLETMRKM